MKKIKIIYGTIFLAFFVGNFQISNGVGSGNSLEILRDSLVGLKTKLEALKYKLSLLKIKLEGLTGESGAHVVSKPTTLRRVDTTAVTSQVPELQQTLEQLVGLRTFLMGREEEDVAIISAKNLEAFLETRKGASFQDFVLEMAEISGLEKDLLKMKVLSTFAKLPGKSKLQEKKVDLLVKKIAKKWRLKTLEKTNPVREKLAKWWIRNAAVRVFHDNMRSFLEIVVNACDATLKKHGVSGGVGKFGLGFFSILSFLAFEETGGTVMTIKTSFKPESAKSSDEYDVYQMGFDRIFRTAKKDRKFNDWNDADIQLLFKWLGEDKRDEFFKQLEGEDYDTENPPTGTLIEIKPKTENKTFSEDTIRKLELYMHYLDDYEKVKINLHKQYIKTGALQNESIGKGSYSVDVWITPERLAVKDCGSGISLSVALLSLMIPSVSTKDKGGLSKAREDALKANSLLPKFFDYRKSDKSKKYSHFIITINGVIVIDKDLGIKLTDEKEHVRDLLVSMPQATQLTLARDEIEFSLNGDGFEDKYFNKIITETIEGFFKNKLTDSSIIEAFYHGLTEYEKQTAAHQIYGRFTSFFRQEMEKQLEANKLVYTIPSAYKSGLLGIFNFFKDVKDKKSKILPISLELANNNFTKFEHFLYEAANEKIKKLTDGSIEQKLMKKCVNEEIISGMKVYIVPDKFLTENDKLLVTSLGLRSSIFVPQSFFNDSSKQYDEDSAIKDLCNKIVSYYSDYPITIAQTTEIFDSPFIISTVTDDVVVYDENGRKLTDYSREEFYNKKFNGHKKRFGFSLESCKSPISFDFAFFDHGLKKKENSSGICNIFIADSESANLFKIHNDKGLIFETKEEVSNYFNNSIYENPNFLLYALLYRYGVSQKASLEQNDKLYLYNPKSSGEKFLTLFPTKDNNLQSFGQTFSWLWLYTLNDNRLITYDHDFEELCSLGKLSEEIFGQNSSRSSFNRRLKRPIKGSTKETLKYYQTITEYKNFFFDSVIVNFLDGISCSCQNDKLFLDAKNIRLPIFIGLKGKNGTGST